MASLVPMLIFCDVIMWYDIRWLRALVVYWQIVAWAATFIILNGIFAKGEQDA